MLKHRIFIAINFPADLKKALIFYQKKWAELPVRWTKGENLHLTLAFIGYVGDSEVLGILEESKRGTEGHHPFSINFNRICLGPPDKAPRMFWVEGEKNRNLAILRYGLEKELLGVQSEKEIREFKPHITLGRIKTFEWRQLKKRPNIEENINLVCPVNSIEIMESQLKPGGPDYFILESINLE